MLLDCNLYMDVRSRWKKNLASVNVDICNAILGYEANKYCIEREDTIYWNIFLQEMIVTLYPIAPFGLHLRS